MHPRPVYEFMEDMKDAGFTPRMVMNQGFHYAIQYQKEQHFLHQYTTPQPSSCSQMEQAAKWVGAVALALGIHPVQMETEQNQYGGWTRKR